jgi:hypothetical protein
MMIKTPKFVERFLDSGYALGIANGCWFAVAAAAGVLQALAGSPWWAGFNFFCAGVSLGCTISVLAVPYRIRHLTDIERANVDRQIREIAEQTVADLKRRGVLPPGVELGVENVKPKVH